MLEEEAKKRMSIGGMNKGVEKVPNLDKGRTSEKAGKLFNVSEKYVREAKKRQIRKPESVLEKVPKQPFHAPKEAGKIFQVNE